MRWALPAASLVMVACALLPVGSVLADPQAAPSPSPPNADVQRVLDLTNAERAKAGLDPLTVSVELTRAAQGYSQVLASGDCFEHTCGPVPNFTDRDVAAGYLGWTTLGENLAGGFSTPDAVMAGWMASPNHRANILSVNFTEIGIGVTAGNARLGTCWTQEFGSRDDSATATTGE